MKKVIALFIALSLLFAFTGCISKQDLEDAKGVAYQDGYDAGYAEGESAGYDSGYSDAEEESFESAFDMGYGAGWSDGYDSGYDDGEADAKASAPTASTSSTPRTDYVTSSDSMVYVSRTGTKYHNNPNCSNMNNPDYVSLETAIAQGRSACSKCY